jgi:hypothetical protein
MKQLNRKDVNYVYLRFGYGLKFDVKSSCLSYTRDQINDNLKLDVFNPFHEMHTLLSALAIIEKKIRVLQLEKKYENFHIIN